MAARQFPTSPPTLTLLYPLLYESAMLISFTAVHFDISILVAPARPPIDAPPQSPEVFLLSIILYPDTVFDYSIIAAAALCGKSHKTAYAVPLFAVLSYLYGILVF